MCRSPVPVMLLLAWAVCDVLCFGTELQKRDTGILEFSSAARLEKLASSLRLWLGSRSAPVSRHSFFLQAQTTWRLLASDGVRTKARPVITRLVVEEAPV